MNEDFIKWAYIKMNRQERYLLYLYCKITFLEELIEKLMNIYNRGGTIPAFPDFDEWKENIKEETDA